MKNKEDFLTESKTEVLHYLDESLNDYRNQFIFDKDKETAIVLYQCLQQIIYSLRSLIKHYHRYNYQVIKTMLYYENIQILFDYYNNGEEEYQMYYREIIETILAETMRYCVEIEYYEIINHLRSILETVRYNDIK